MSGDECENVSHVVCECSDSAQDIDINFHNDIMQVMFHISYLLLSDFHYSKSTTMLRLICVGFHGNGSDL